MDTETVAPADAHGRRGRTAAGGEGKRGGERGEPRRAGGEGGGRARPHQIRRLQLDGPHADAVVAALSGRDRGRLRAVPPAAPDDGRDHARERGLSGRDAGHRTSGRVGGTRAVGRVLAPAVRGPAAGPVVVIGRLPAGRPAAAAAAARVSRIRCW